MPYPHASAAIPVIKSDLGLILRQLGHEVISFDPPGIFQSSREPRLAMEEMVSCARETIEFLNLTDEEILLVGHSMGGFCSLAYMQEYPESVTKVVLVGTLASFSAIRRHSGLPWWLSKFDGNFWRILYYGIRLMFFRGNLAVQKKLNNLYEEASWYKKENVVLETIDGKDNQKSPSPRANWPRIARKYDFSTFLPRTTQPALILVGRHDPQTPAGCSEEIHELIPNSRLVIFENSGHFPFSEEPELFSEEVATFLKK